MYLEIVTPEAILFSGEVTSVAVPGVDGEFQMLDNHAPIVSLLGQGQVKVWGDMELNEDVASKFTKENDVTLLSINSGTLEMKDNRVIVLAD
ncbi:F0F1 ATP synthase subunit epsilon [Aquimarina sp. U1-2]|uniref:F0F1 ATP synthase subunit epsilon n=1 Tax=Aquimarina sp. U1-2 TaxID=2823141 RepID=UPI001AECF685|nr:F0F1 ATP synthase subunit epsilon [Aquimarina sp. U1-2]MBP2831346.1 F0F1 ATP synthase subunit epsilon [Aquimarina sp. U1-2]